MTTLTKITLYAAFEGDVNPETLAEHLAEQLRLGHDALTVASEYDSAESALDPKDNETDDLIDALTAHFPEAALHLGPVPGVTVSGRNGTFKKAHLKLNGTRIELWLGTEKERYPLITFPAHTEGR